MPELYCLYEFASGYGLVHVREWEQIGQDSASVQDAVTDLSRLSEICVLKAFHAFENAEEALENMNKVASGEASDALKNFLELNLPKKKGKYQVGVADAALGKSLADAGFSVAYDKNIQELLRAVRTHFAKISKGLKEFDIDRARCGLGHAYSRTKMQLDPNRQDKPIIQSIALIDMLDKSLNLFAMRVREWYCWHFPELAKIVTDNQKFSQIAVLLQNRETFDFEERRQEVVDVVGSEEVADELIQAAKTSMGQDISETDMANIEKFADLVVKLSAQRAHLAEYIQSKLAVVAPNLQAVVGEMVAARLLAQAGSLTTLAKYPASTVQILGAEKALFRALKTKGKTPKYGLLFQSTFIGRAAQKNKGRISRYLANKCSIAARIDNFSPMPSSVFGERLRDQVEERLQFLTEGITPRKNLDVMRDAVAAYGAAAAAAGVSGKKKKKKKQAVEEDGDVTMEAVEENGDASEKKKKKKKRAAEEMEASPPAETVAEPATKKKKKKKKAAEEDGDDD
uniref:Nucleolar protein 56 n=1 Tax=Chromera velia CCMP2878 TaxID=1169474 RepID=A0A0G4I955_9ALVE|mmetsp:Transcript_5670/g.11262  ORF Transcript_5670/g.11262 Transcript_5670/m.11262 type:complete len:513 (-) Transcript_5670:1109-2647(-)|eukprot:Cvel_12135.t1-p1 / transcript=Cvel_12135.t1 / gene=Cvel_12135 / organism=Chromera_velia_CCMP2878 / gene_product=Nucleolar protein 56, putative / transcript_product=Nucleolar protein 56, putative / location=Cvel_scaffold782:10526-12061(+) / protein_length=512 / sequence_SO=supercontig / SO=protein_coding / is_pseudo=false